MSRTDEDESRKLERERQRLETLRRLRFPDAIPGSTFDPLVSLTARLLEASAAFISLVNDTGQWFVSCIGPGFPPDRVVPPSLCAHVVETGRPLVVGDASQDDRFRDAPRGRGKALIGFYAGAPLKASDGQVIGTLCVIDAEARQGLPPDKFRILEDMAASVARILEGHMQTVEALRRREEELLDSRDKLRLAVAAADLGTWDADFRKRSIGWAERTKELLGYQSNETVTREDFLRRVHPADRDMVGAALDSAFDPSGSGFYSATYRVILPNGRTRWISSRGQTVFEDQDGRRVPVRFSGSMADVTDREERERFLQAIMDSLIAFVVVLTLDGTVVYANQLCFDVSGYGRDEVIGRHFAEVPWFAYDPEVASRIRTALDEARAGAISRFDTRVRLSDGGFRDIELDVGPMRGDSNGLLVSSAIDITERVRSGAALRESEERFRTMAENAPIVVWVSDADGSGSYLNRRWTELTGQSVEEALVTGWFAPVHPDDVERSRAFYQEALQRRETFRLDYRLRRADGSYAWVIDTGAPRIGPNGEFLGYVGSVIDISDRMAAEEALKANEERLRVMTNAVPALIWVNDTAGNARRFNDRWYAYTGLDMDRSLGTAGWSVIHPDDVPRVAPIWQEAIARGTAYEAEYRYRRHDGVYRWFLGRAEPVRDAQGRILEWIGASIDIHDLHTMREALTAALAEKDVLIREVHHRVKNNLQAIWALVQLESLRVQDNPESRKRLRAIAERLDVMGRLHQQIYRSDDLARVDLAPYLDQLAHSLVDLHGEAERIAISVRAEPLECGIDTAFPLGLIANEVITNSLKHAFPDGRQGRICVDLHRTPAGSVELVLADDGIGASGIGVPLDASRSIGMVLIQSLASQLDAVWTIEAGEGTTVRLVLPPSSFPYSPPTPRRWDGGPG